MTSAMPEIHLPLPKISDECHIGFLVVFYSDSSSSLNRTVCLFVCLFVCMIALLKLLNNVEEVDHLGFH